MKHQRLISFAASLVGPDGDGIRLCVFLGPVPANRAPKFEAKLVFAGFRFVHTGNPLVHRDLTTHRYEPADPVRYERFDLTTSKVRRQDPRGLFLDGCTAIEVGVLVARGGRSVVDLINALKKGHRYALGQGADGSFKPYDSRRPTRRLLLKGRPVSSGGLLYYQ